MARTCFSISFYCRESKVNKDGLSPLEMCININQQRLFLNLPVKFPPKEFNKKRRPAYMEDLLAQYRIKTNEIMADLMAEGLPITASTLRESLRTGGTKSKTIKDLTTEYLEYIKPRVGKSMGKDVYRKYELVALYLCDKLGSNKELATITNMDMSNIYESLKNDFMPSTSAGYMTKVKTIITYAVDNGLMKKNPTNLIKLERTTPKIEYLTQEDIQAIKDLDLSEYPRLEKVRDLMLFQASIGTAYCDMVDFTWNNVKEIDGLYIYTNNRHKTGVEFTAVILPNGLEVLKKYNYRLPLISNQKYNKYMKEIQTLAGIDTYITSHILRKSYATYLLNEGVNISVVAKCLGHSNTNITQRCYAKTTDRLMVNEFKKIG